MSPPQCNFHFLPDNSPASTPDTPCEDKSILRAHCIHRRYLFRGQEQSSGTLHPHQIPYLWTNPIAYRSSSTPDTHFVDKCCSAPHSIHAEWPFCGQTLQRTALHPRRSTILRTNAAAHRTSSTPDILCVEESMLPVLSIRAMSPLATTVPLNVVFIKVFVTFAAKY